VDLWAAPPLDTRGLFDEERRDLLALLDSLEAAEWSAPSAARGWTVKDLALHLLDGDLGRLSRGRDADLSGALDGGHGKALAQALAAKNQRWLDATRGLSSRVIQDLLRFSTQEISAWTAEDDLLGPARVSWAGDEPVPTWLDHGRELTETWVHHQQIREATGRRPSDARLSTVLSIFVWAFPHQYRVPAPTGVVVNLDLDAAGEWHLRSVGGSRWTLEGGPGPRPAAAVRFSPDAAWRSMTGATVPLGGVHSVGPDDLIRPLMEVRGIIA